MGFGVGLALELEEGCFDVSCHGDAHISVDVVPLECETKVFIPGLVLCGIVILSEGFEQVVGVCFPCVLDPKIIDDKRKNEVCRVVSPEGRCVWNRGISIPC